MNPNVRVVEAKISSLEGLALDWQVSILEEVTLAESPDAFKRLHLQGVNCYSKIWNLAGPIIEREGISFREYYRPGTSGHGTFYARVCRESGQMIHWSRQTSSTGPTPLIAAMRCYVASKTEGDSVTVPEELL